MAGGGGGGGRGCGGRVGGSIKAWPSCSCEPPTAQSGESSRRKLFQVSCTAWLVGARVKTAMLARAQGERAEAFECPSVRVCVHAVSPHRCFVLPLHPRLGEAEAGKYIEQHFKDSPFIQHRLLLLLLFFCLSNIALINNQHTRDNSGDF